MTDQKNDYRSNTVRLECGHLRKVANKRPKPGIGDVLYCMECDDHVKVKRREIWNG